MPLEDSWLELLKPTTNKVQVCHDDGCNMEKVLINGKPVMEGNSWDFHPGCHGFNKIGPFTSADGLADRIVQTINDQGAKVVRPPNKPYRFRY